MSMLDEDDSKSGMELADKDAGDGGSDGVTDLGGVPSAVPSNTSTGKKKSLDIIAAGIKRSMGR
jgi:hypothetical protein